jgi:hypothetical protein
MAVRFRGAYRTTHCPPERRVSMMRHLRIVPLVAVTVAAGELAPPAMASESVSAGVARAMTAGITVSPEAAKMMALAPAGTCMADPTAPRCPKVKRIVAAAAAATGCTPQAVRPEKSTNTEAYGTGYSVNCASNIVFNEVTTTLQLYTDSRTWRQLDVAIRSRSGRGDVGATARFSCSNTRTPVYLFRTKAVSYSRTSGGTAYLRTAYKENLLACR